MSETKMVVESGASGLDAEDFASMLADMYACANTDVDVAREAGVHKLVRVSPFDPHGRRVSCFASVSVAGRETPARLVRTYVLDPYQRVTDHIGDVQSPHVEAILGGNLRHIYTPGSA